MFFKKVFKIASKFREEFLLVKGAGCKSSTRQLIEVIQLLFRAQLTPGEYYFNRFFELDKDYSFMLNFLSNYHLANYYRPALADGEWTPITENKLLFNRYYSSFGLPVNELYGYYDSQNGITTDGTPLTNIVQLKEFLLELKPPTIVFKPVGGSKGQNILIFNSIHYGADDIVFTSNEGKDLTLSQVVLAMEKKVKGSSYQGFVMEPKVEQDQGISSLNSSSLNTIRVITILNKANQASVLCAALRLGRKGVGVDNFSQGGLFVAINLTEGILGKGFFGTKIRSDFYQLHPDTEVPFSGFKIPFWKEVYQLACKAARVSPFCRSIGWDIAITPEGPVILEGNDKHSVRMQALYNGYLQPEVRHSLAEFSLEFPKGKLPRYNIRNIIKAIRIWAGK